jgi:hypothetical protein
MTTLVIDNSTIQARQFVQFTRTLPFVTVKNEKPAAKSEIKLSDRFRGVFSKEAAESFNNHTKAMREEWDDI